MKLLVQCWHCIYRPAWGSWDNSDYQTKLPPAWFNRRRFWWRTLELQLGMIIKPSSKVWSPWATLTNDITIASRKGMWCLVSLCLTFSCHKNWWMRSALLLVTHSTNICRGASPPKHFLFWVKLFNFFNFLSQNYILKNLRLRPTSFILLNHRAQGGLRSIPSGALVLGNLLELVLLNFRVKLYE